MAFRRGLGSLFLGFLRFSCHCPTLSGNYFSNCVRGCSHLYKILGQKVLEWMVRGVHYVMNVLHASRLYPTTVKMLIFCIFYRNEQNFLLRSPPGDSTVHFCRLKQLRSLHFACLSVLNMVDRLLTNAQLPVNAQLMHLCSTVEIAR